MHHLELLGTFVAAYLICRVITNLAEIGITRASRNGHRGLRVLLELFT